jgi:hypothetical protein
MSPNAQPLSYFQSCKNDVLLSYGFEKAELPLTEIASLQSVLATVKLGIIADVFTNELLHSLQQHSDKPFALCLYTGDGWLHTAIPFAAVDTSFHNACQRLTALINPVQHQN